jgi:tetratricopeptide (TPR) repeat protein
MPLKKLINFLSANCLYPVCLFVIFFVIGCSNPFHKNDEKEEFEELTKLFDVASKKADSGNIAGGARFVDSSLGGKKLTVKEKFKVFDYKNDLYFFWKDTAHARMYADSMLDLIQKSGKENYREEYAQANYAKGGVLFEEKKYNEAYQHYFIARHIGKTNLNSCTLSEYGYRVGMILFQQSRFLEAAKNFEEAFEQSKNCPTNFVVYYRRQEILSNISLCFQRVGRFDSALLYSDRALQYVKEYDGHFKDKPYFNEIARGVIYGNQGQIFKEEGDYKKAEELFKKSIEINSKKGGDNRDAQLNQLMLAEVYFLTNQPDSMQGILLKSRKSLDSIENKQAEIDWNRLSWKYYDSKQQPALAYKYLKTFTALNDSVQKVKNELNTYDVSEQINTLENEYKINSLEKENKVKNLYLLIFVITTAFGVAIFLFALFILRNTKTNYKILEGLNKQIKEQKIRLEEALQKVEEKSKEKDRILRGVAHDLRTPAASISMLTDLILTENDDKARSEMLKLVKTSCDNSLELM